MNLDNIANQVSEIAFSAGDAILKVYDSDFDYQIKSDKSPLTEADIKSHQIISKKLSKLTPSIPVLSEEESIKYEIRSSWKKYWLIDPLDGTKEFVKKNGEFTVNIALIENNRPILGVILQPTNKKIYIGFDGGGSSVSIDKEKAKNIFVNFSSNNEIKFAVSRSHPSSYLEKYLSNFKKIKKIAIGSSLKFCLLAEGKADVYPRFGPTSEWDTGAGQAILEFAGGSVINQNGKKLEYNKKKDLINGYFLAISSQDQKILNTYIDHM